MAYNTYHWKRSAEIPLRAAIRNRLVELGYPFYQGAAPDDFTAYPLIILDNVTENEFVTKRSEGSEMVVKVDVYCHEEGYDEVIVIKDQVIQAFNAPLQIDSDWKIVLHALDSPGSITFKQSAYISHSVLYIRFKLVYVG